METVSVLFFAGLAERIGARRAEVPIRPGETVQSFLERLAAEYPPLAGHLATLMVAVDEEYVERETPLVPGATVALIPPVSGG